MGPRAPDAASPYRRAATKWQHAAAPIRAGGELRWMGPRLRGSPLPSTNPGRPPSASRPQRLIFFDAPRANDPPPAGRVRAPGTRTSPRASYVIHERQPAVLLLGGVHLADQIGERGLIEHRGNAVAHLAHDHSRAAMFDVLALIARLEGGFAGAGQRSQGTLEQSNYRPDGNCRRWAVQLIAAAFSLFAFEHAAAFDIEQNAFQKLEGNVFPGSQRGNEHRSFSIAPAQRNHRLEAILGPFGDRSHPLTACQRRRMKRLRH